MNKELIEFDDVKELSLIKFEQYMQSISAYDLDKTTLKEPYLRGFYACFRAIKTGEFTVDVGNVTLQTLQSKS